MVFLGGPHQGPPRMDQDAMQAAKVAVEDFMVYTRGFMDDS
jgi:hypothetical protein